VGPRILGPRHWMEVGGLLHALAALPPGEESQVPIGWEAGWAPEPVWRRCRREEFRAPAGNRTPIVQHVAVMALYFAVCFTNILCHFKFLPLAIISPKCLFMFLLVHVNEGFRVFLAMGIEIVVFKVLTSCSDMVFEPSRPRLEAYV